MRSICLIQLNAAYLHGCHGMRSIMGICGPRESNSLFRNTFLLVVCAVLCCVALTGMHGWLNRSHVGQPDQENSRWPGEAPGSCYISLLSDFFEQAAKKTNFDFEGF
jgi:hypothetical protein